MDKHSFSQLAQHPWAIMPNALSTLVARMATSEVLEPQAAARSNVRAGATAIVPIQGVLRQKPATFMDEMFGEGGTSYERLGATMRMLAADESIGTIVLDINSPGGSVFGVTEAADAIFKARDSKRIVAVANSIAASGAYWLASQAHEIIVTPSGIVGSIGVIAIHQELSKMAEMEGVGITVLTAGKYKGDGNRFEPLTDDVKERMQAEIDDYYGQFVAAVARGRGVKASEVKAGYGEGGTATAKAAVAMKLVDKVGTLADVLGRSGESGEAMASLTARGTHLSAELVADMGLDACPHCETEADDHETQLEAERWKFAQIGA